MNSGLVDLFGDCDDESTSSSVGSLSQQQNKRRAKQNNRRLVKTGGGVLQSSDEDNNNDKAAALPPEIERGNIEYKLKLIDPSPVRFEHLVTQMKWRLQEGLGEAIYEIGVSDDGYLKGLDAAEMSKSLETLKRMAERLGASMNIIREVVVESGCDENDMDDDEDDDEEEEEEENNENIEKSSSVVKTVGRKAAKTQEQQRKAKMKAKAAKKKTKKVKKTAAEVLIRRVPDDSQFIDIRIAVLGNVDCGKSTLISVLTYDELDNGQGRARLNLLRHIHEIQSGRTSSISKEIMGFNDAARVQNFGNCRSAEEIFENSSKLISFIDLAGHSKYMKTTVFGLTGYEPDFTMLVINANNGIVGTTKEHLGFSMALEVRVFIVVNKIDMCSESCLERTLSTIEFLLKSPGCGKIPIRVNTDDDAIYAAQQFNQPRVCPIFTISCVKGTNLDKLKKFLHILPPAMSKHDRENEIQQMPEFRVDEVFFKKKPGHILAGMLLKGSIQEHEKLLLGPMEFGEFVPVEVQTIQRYRVPCRIVRAGQTAAVSIGTPENITEKLRKGMVLIHPKLEPTACREFEATIYLLFHANQIHKGFQATVHIGNVVQTAFISYMDRNAIKTNEGARVNWQFKSRAEYITVGSRLIFREGNTKGLGEVTKIYPLDETSNNSSPPVSSERRRHESGGSNRTPPNENGGSGGGGGSSSPTHQQLTRSKIQRTTNSCSIADSRHQETSD